MIFTIVHGGVGCGVCAPSRLCHAGIRAVPRREYDSFVLSAMDSSLVRKRLEIFEGNVPYLYRCTGGAVTIGIGHAIPAAEAALGLPWTIGGRPATPQEIRKDYTRISSAPKGLVAGRYEDLSRCRLSADAIDALAAADITRFTGMIEGVLSNWARYPDCAQQALFDMGFNLGIAGLRKFGKLLAACDAGDWNTAARECHRMGISDDRNQQTAALFRQALT